MSRFTFRKFKAKNRKQRAKGMDSQTPGMYPVRLERKTGQAERTNGSDYTDYNLILALKTGRPCEDRIIGNQFERLKKSAGLPDVVFHSLRHSSTTYKLNKGDLKATPRKTTPVEIHPMENPMENRGLI